MYNDISKFSNNFYLRNLVLLESPVVHLPEDLVLEDPYLPILVSRMISYIRRSYETKDTHVYSKTEGLVHFSKFTYFNTILSGMNFIIIIK